MIYCFPYIEENDAAEFVLKTSMIVEENVFFRNFAVVCCRACDRNLGGEKKPGLECVCVCVCGKQVFCWLLAAGQAVCLYSCRDFIFGLFNEASCSWVCTAIND